MSLLTDRDREVQSPLYCIGEMILIYFAISGTELQLVQKDSSIENCYTSLSVTVNEEKHHYCNSEENFHTELNALREIQWWIKP